MPLSTTVIRMQRAHSNRLFFQPFVGSLPASRHSSQVIGFVKSNFLFELVSRNFVRGKLRLHTWHVIGFAAASCFLCSFTSLSVLPPNLPEALPKLPESLPKMPESLPKMPDSLPQ